MRVQLYQLQKLVCCLVEDVRLWLNSCVVLQDLLDIGIQVSFISQSLFLQDGAPFGSADEGAQVALDGELQDPRGDVGCYGTVSRVQGLRHDFANTVQELRVERLKDMRGQLAGPLK